MVLKQLVHEYIRDLYWLILIPLLNIWQNSRPAYFLKDYWRIAQALDANVSLPGLKDILVSLAQKKTVNFAHVSRRDQASEICNQGEFM